LNKKLYDIKLEWRLKAKVVDLSLKKSKNMLNFFKKIDNFSSKDWFYKIYILGENIKYKVYFFVEQISISTY